MRLFQSLATAVPRPATLLDVGGTTNFWRRQVPSGFSVTVLNVFEQELCEGIRTVVGDGCDLSRFEDQSYDVVFSNAVLCLAGSWERQQQMAAEIRRVGRRYFVQTANRNFPVDWRTLVPMFHWMSPATQAWCFQRFRVGRYPRARDAVEALELATRVRDLAQWELGQLFPDGTIIAERMLGMTKSLMVHRGFSPEAEIRRPGRYGPREYEAKPYSVGTKAGERSEASTLRVAAP